MLTRRPCGCRRPVLFFCRLAAIRALVARVLVRAGMASPGSKRKLAVGAEAPVDGSAGNLFARRRLEKSAGSAEEEERRKRKHQDIAYELEHYADADVLLEGKTRPPERWTKQWNGIAGMRARVVAAVDDMGCGEQSQKRDTPEYRYQVLTSLMLSSQTKDPVTAAAVEALTAHGLTVDNILATPDAKLDSLIAKVGFHNRKTTYMKKTAAILKEQHAGDIPRTLEGLMALPGVGPKMATLCMQHAWDENHGIGVDVHVHRIANRLGWTGKRKTATPEQTRAALEDWLPRSLWAPVNPMLVGFGQTTCRPVGPLCGECDIKSVCPTGRRA